MVLVVVISQQRGGREGGELTLYIAAYLRVKLYFTAMESPPSLSICFPRYSQLWTISFWTARRAW